MSALVEFKFDDSLVAYKKEYAPMLENIKKKFPAVEQASSNFYKSKSQFSNFTIDVTMLTPIRSIKHTLAEIENIKRALQSSYFKIKKGEVKLRRKREKLETCNDPYERELLELDIQEKENDILNSKLYHEGAIRKLNFFINQYDHLMKHIGKDKLTEEDYEREEVKYHIMTMLKQALCSARPRGGLIDEGNSIYIFELGLSPAEVQAEIFSLLKWEEKMINDGLSPPHTEIVKWMEACAEKWAHLPGEFIERRGLMVMDESSLVNKLENKGED
jgi:hypothetical protein